MKNYIYENGFAIGYMNGDNLIRYSTTIRGFSAMWNHYCLQEQSSMEIGDDEPCNWCGAVEVALVQAANEEDRGKGNVVSGLFDGGQG